MDKDEGYIMTFRDSSETFLTLFRINSNSHFHSNNVYQTKRNESMLTTATVNALFSSTYMLPTICGKAKKLRPMLWSVQCILTLLGLCSSTCCLILWTCKKSIHDNVRSYLCSLNCSKRWILNTCTLRGFIYGIYQIYECVQVSIWGTQHWQCHGCRTVINDSTIDYTDDNALYISVEVSVKGTNDCR